MNATVIAYPGALPASSSSAPPPRCPSAPTAWCTGSMTLRSSRSASCGRAGARRRWPSDRCPTGISARLPARPHARRVGRARPSTPWPTGIDDLIEEQIYRYAGSYVFVLDDTEHRRVYLDAGSSLSAVFAPDRLLCASTTGLLLDAQEYARRFDKELHDYLHVADAGWFLAGLTAHRGITRMLANHYLDLDDGVQHRHWPHAPLPVAKEPDEARRRERDRRADRAPRSRSAQRRRAHAAARRDRGLTLVDRVRAGGTARSAGRASSRGSTRACTCRRPATARSSRSASPIPAYPGAAAGRRRVPG